MFRRTPPWPNHPVSGSYPMNLIDSGHERRRCARDTYPETYIIKYTSTKIKERQGWTSYAVPRSPFAKIAQTHTYTHTNTHTHTNTQTHTLSLSLFLSLSLSFSVSLHLPLLLFALSLSVALSRALSRSHSHTHTHLVCLDEVGTVLDVCDRLPRVLPRFGISSSSLKLSPS